MLSKSKSLLKKAGRRLASVHNPDWMIHDLPWRKGRSPYRIFLAEFLLVRTRFDVVARLFEKIYSEYPNITKLALAEETLLENLLRPLGLKKRTPILIKAANYIQENLNGDIPEPFDDLLKIPGIGIYAAGAIRTFAFGKQEVPADVNVYRFVSRLTGLPMEHPTKGSAEIRDLLPLLSEETGGPEAESLLDFSSQICKSRTPNCKECLLTNYCHYWAELNSP